MRGQDWSTISITSSTPQQYSFANTRPQVHLVQPPSQYTAIVLLSEDKTSSTGESCARTRARRCPRLCSDCRGWQMPAPTGEAIIRLPAFAPPHTSHLVRHLVSICYSLKMYFWTLLPQAYMFLIIPRTWSLGIYGNTKYSNLPHYYIDKSVRGECRNNYFWHTFRSPCSPYDDYN